MAGSDGKLGSGEGPVQLPLVGSQPVTPASVSSQDRLPRGPTSGPFPLSLCHPGTKLLTQEAGVHRGIVALTPSSSPFSHGLHTHGHQTHPSGTAGEHSPDSPASPSEPGADSAWLCSGQSCSVRVLTCLGAVTVSLGLHVAVRSPCVLRQQGGWTLSAFVSCIQAEREKDVGPVADTGADAPMQQAGTSSRPWGWGQNTPCRHR